MLARAVDGGERMQYALAWIPVLGVTVASALVADAARFRVRARLRGHWAASGLFVLLVTAYVAASMDRLTFASPGHALLVGTAWALATFLVDVLVGVVVMRGDWARVLAPYDPRAGHFWAAALLWVALVPVLAHLLLD